MKLRNLLMFAFFTLAVVSMSAHGYQVVDDDWAGADHSSIQDALDDASAGETIQVNAGTYGEDLTANVAVVIAGNGTETLIDSSTTALTGLHGIEISNVMVQGQDGLDLGDDCVIEGVIIDVSGIGVSTGQRAFLGNNSFESGSVQVGDGSHFHQSIFNSVEVNLSADCLFEDGVLQGCDLGISGSGTEVTGNDIRDSAIVLSGSGNIVHDNILRANAITDAFGNLWNATPTAGTSIVGGSTLGGNFWYEYPGTDGDADDIGDTPFEVDAGVNDEAPLLYPQVAPVITDVFVTPVNDSYKVERTFSLVYTDMNNEAPAFVRAVFDDFSTDLTSVGSDEPRNGTSYEATTLVEAGNHTFHYEVSDGTSTTSSTSMVLISVNHAPTVTFDIDPATGFRTTNVTIDVAYSDADDDAPAYLEARITGSNGTVAVPLSEVYPLDDDFTDGKDFTVTLSFEADRYVVAVASSDGSNNRTTGAVNLTIENSQPELTDSVSPDSGSTQTVFNFSLLYIDIDGDAPDSLVLHVDSVDAPITNDPPDYEAGVLYTIEISLDKGNHNYWFSARDSAGSENETGERHLLVQNTPPAILDVDVTIDHGLHNFNVTVMDVDAEQPEYTRLVINSESHEMSLTGELNTTFFYERDIYVPEGVHQYYVQVSDDTATNVSDLAILNTTGYPDLVNVTISPDDPLSKDSITLGITYLHDEGTMAEYVHALIDSTVHQMNLTGGDATDGANYETTVRLARGTYNISFNASDGVHLNVTDTIALGVLNTPPKAVLNVLPAIPEPDTNITLTISYSDTDEDAPKSTRVEIDGERVTMTPDDLGDGKWIITGQANISQGSHYIDVRYGDGFGNDTIRWWFPVDNAPTFNVTTWRRDSNRNVSLNVTAFDADNDSLTAVLVLNGTEYPLEKVDALDLDSTDGIGFHANITFPEGIVDYLIVVNDTVLEADLEFQENVVVVINEAPTLSQVDVFYQNRSNIQQVRFEVKYKDTDGNQGLNTKPKVILVVDHDPPIPGIEAERTVLITGGPDPQNALYGWVITLQPGRYVYHFEATDGRDDVATEPMTLNVIVPEDPETEESAETPLDMLLGYLQEPMYLMFIFVIIVIIGAAMGAASRGRAPKPSAPAEIEHPGYPDGSAPMSREDSAWGDDEPERRPRYDGAPIEFSRGDDDDEVEFKPSGVAFARGSPRPVEDDDDDDDMDWRPSRRPHAGGPFVAPRGGTDEFEVGETRRSDADKWDAFSTDDDSGFEKEPSYTAPPSDDGFGEGSWGDEDHSSGGHDEGWGEDSWGEDHGTVDDGPADGWESAPDSEPEDSWEKPPEPESDSGWQEETVGDTQVRELGSGKKKGFGMFDDIDEIDVSDWDDW